MDQNLLHDKISFKAQQRRTSLSVVSSGYHNCSPAFSWGPGIRDHYLLHLVLSGSGYYLVNGQKYQLQRGDLFLIYPQNTVLYQADELDPWSYSWVGFNGSDAAYLLGLAGFSTANPVQPVKDVDSMASRLRMIYDNRGSQPRDDALMTGHLYLLIAELMDSKIHALTPADPLLTCARTAAAFIAGNYYQPLTVGDLADYAGVSRSTLFRSFRRHHGLSPMQYIIRLRIEKACALLRGTDSPVNELARSVGFDDPLYFSRAFRKLKGVTPSRYQRGDQI